MLNHVSLFVRKKIVKISKKLVPSLGWKSVSEIICTYYYYHKKQSYLSFRFTIFFGYLTKFYNYYNSKGAIYLNNNTIKWINCDLSFFSPSLWSYCFPSTPLPFSSCLLLLCGEWNLNFERSYFFWAGFGTCHEGSGTKSYNLVLFWPLCPFCLPSAAIGQRSSQLWLTLFCPTDSYSIYVQVLSCRLLARNGRRWPKLHLFNVDVTQKVFKLTLDALDCLGSILSDISGANIFHQIFPKEILHFFYL